MMDNDNNGIGVDDAVEVTAEKLAVTWYLQNACHSNVQLATITNVCRQWRIIALGNVAAEAVALATGCDDAEGELRGAGENSFEPDSAQLANPSASSVQRLMITDMARELVGLQQHDVNGERAERATPNNTKSCGSFCLAWFAPSGIQIVPIPIDDEDEDEDDGDSDAAGTRHVTCCSEWRGYRHATEVLIPFGYSTDFVQVSLFVLCALFSPVRPSLMPCLLAATSCMLICS